MSETKGAEAKWTAVSGGLSPFFKFKAPGDKLAGKITAKRVGQTPEGKPQDLYDIETATGPFTVAASNKDLAQKLSKVEVGKLVSIEFKETRKVPGRPLPMKIYNVLVAG